jgi:hypothetical protein
MSDGYVEVLAMIVMAVVVLLVVGAGTTLVYLADARRDDASRGSRDQQPEGEESARGARSPRGSDSLDRAA